MLAELFVNYRRSDSAWAAGRIGDRLSAALGSDSVFLDTITIEPGVDFVEAIGDHIEECNVLLSVIGDNWIEILQSRQTQANDFVRIEIAQALARGVRIVPVVVDNAQIPSESDLPEDLKSLARLNAVRITSDSFDADIAHFLQFLSTFLGRATTIDVEPSGAVTTDKPEPRSDIGLTHRTEFWKIGKDGKPRHRIFVSIVAPTNALNEIAKVTYQLHPTFKNPVREIIDSRNNFELRTNGWGEFTIGASVHFKHSAEPVHLRHKITFDSDRAG